MQACVYYGSTTRNLLVQHNTTLRQILQALNISDTIIFCGSLTDSRTPLVDLDKTLVDYNMWFLDGYIAELTVYKETDNYNKELYHMYLASR